MDTITILTVCFFVAFVIAAAIIIDHNRAWGRVKKRVGLSKEIEIPETAQLKPAPKDTLIKFWHPEMGVFRHTHAKELPNGKIALFNDKGLPVKELSSVRLKNWRPIVLDGKINEIVLDIDDESYYASLMAEKEAHKLQIRSLQEERIRLSKSTGDVMIEHAKVENKISINKWKGRRMMSSPGGSSKSKSHPAQQSMMMEGGDEDG